MYSHSILLFSGNHLRLIGDKMLNTVDPRVRESLVWIFGNFLPFQWDALNFCILLPKQRQGNGCLHIPGISQNHCLTHLHHPLVLSTSGTTCSEQLFRLELGLSMIIISLAVVPVIQNSEGEKLMIILILILIIMNVRSIFFLYMT